MTVFRSDNAAIALREIGETGITVTLAETFPGNTTAMHAFDLPQVVNPDVLTEVITQHHPLTTEFETIANRAAGLGMHLVQVSL
jgi:hypothetical protein